MRMFIRIRELRKNKGWSSNDLAEILGVSQPTITRWENGSAIPDVNTLKKLSEIFNITVDDLIGDKNSELKITIDDFLSDNLEFSYKNKSLNEKQKRFMRTILKLIKQNL